MRNTLFHRPVVTAETSSEPSRTCQPFQVDFCRQLPYNYTTYPNAMGHASLEEAKHDIERFK